MWLRGIRGRIELERESPFALSGANDGTNLSGRLLHFVARQKRPAISWSLSGEDLAKFKTADETVFVAYVNPEDPAPAEVYSDVARQYRDEFTFGVVDDPAVAEAQGIKVPAVVCYKPLDGDTVQLNELDDPGKVDEWVKEASRPVIGELTGLNRQRLLEVSRLVPVLRSRS